jgi:hypothetical protein
MRPITTQSFLTDLHTLKEAIASDSDVKKSETTGQLRTLYLHEKLANFAQDFFRGNQSKIDRRLDYKENAKKHIVEKMANFISASIGNKPGNDAFNHIYNNAKETIEKSSRDFVTGYTDKIEQKGSLRIGATEIKKITDENYSESHLNKKERENLTAMQSEFLKIDALLATVLPTASWIKENKGWEVDQAMNFARMMSDPYLEGQHVDFQFEIAKKVLGKTGKLIDSDKSKLDITKTQADRLQEDREWILHTYPNEHTDEQIDSISKKMSDYEREGYTQIQKYNFVLCLDPSLGYKPEWDSPFEVDPNGRHS